MDHSNFLLSLQIRELEHELEEVRKAAEKYEEDISGASQDQDVELMDSQVWPKISFDNV